MVVRNIPGSDAPTHETAPETNCLTRVYYVDPATGDDNQPGTTSEKPWRTLSRLNRNRFRPGDTIKLRCGSTFCGTLAPVGSGTEAEPIVVTSYGTGPKPLIDGQGANAAVFLHNVEGWELRNLEITNTGPKPKPTQQRAGIFVQLEDFGVGKHYVVSDVHVRDVNGPDVLEPVPSGGVIFLAGGSSKPTGFDGIQVCNTTIARVDRMGICTQSLWSVRDENPYGRGTTYVPMTRIRLHDNRMEDIGGDGIMVNNGVGALVERNVLDGFGGRAAPGTVVGMYGFNSDKGVFRHNHVRHGKKVAVAFDIETGNIGTLYEFNHTYRNAGGFLLACNDPGAKADDAVIRYNVSHDDRDGDGNWPIGVITLACGVTTNLRIHHNTFHAPNTAIMVNNSDQTAAELSYNVFAGKQDGSVIIDPHGTYHHNVYDNVMIRREVEEKTSAVECCGHFPNAR